MNIRKNKILSIPLFKINGYVFTSRVSIILEYTKTTETIYISSYFVYRKNRIYKNKSVHNGSRGRLTIQNDEDNYRENRIKELMIKNRSITTCELSKLTGFSNYSIYKFYMKLRHELNGRIK